MSPFPATIVAGNASVWTRLYTDVIYSPLLLGTQLLNKLVYEDLCPKLCLSFDLSVVPLLYVQFSI